jgi:hypothetical protein
MFQINRRGFLMAGGLSIGMGLRINATRAGERYVLPKPIKLEAFDSVTGFVASGALANVAAVPSLKLEGAASVYLEGNGVSGLTPLLTKTLPVQYDISQLGVVAYPVFFNERGLTQLYPQLGRGGTFYSPDSPYFVTGQPPGWRWMAFSSFDGAPSGVGQTELRVRGTTIAPYNTRSNIDAIYANAKGRPTVVIGFDDGFRSTYDIALPYMAARDMVGTVYLPTDLIADSARMSNKLILPEVQALADSGWAICLDGTRDDSVMVAKASPAACVTELQEMQAWLAARGFPAEGGKHICYPNGWYQGDAGGNPAVAVQVAAVTCDGSTTVTFGAAATVADGMMVRGYRFPLGTTIVSGGGAGVTSVVLSNAIPAQTVAADFIDKSGAFYYPKLPDALSAAGIKTARTTLQDEMYTRFGFGDQALVTPSRSTSAKTLADLQPFIDHAIAIGATIELYYHEINSTGGSINNKDTDFYAVMDYIHGKKQAGILDVLTKPQWWARDGAARAPY